MSFSAKISSVGGYLPPKVLSNADLEKMVDTTNEWILERTGIHTRHIVEPGVATSDLCVEAARECLSKRGVDPSEIELIIVATVTPDMAFPATACLVQNKMGASKAWGFDISAACSGFVYALQAGAKFIESGAHKKVLVIGADVMSSIIDYTDRTTCIIFGDGAGAVLLEPCKDGEVGLMDFHHEIDGSGGKFLNMPAGGSLNPASAETVANKMHYVHQEGQAVYKFAVKKMAEATSTLLSRNKLSGLDIQCFIPHQANKRIILSAAEQLKIPLKNVLINIDRFGNTTAATIPLGMRTAMEERKLNKGDLVLLASVGAGFTVGATLLRWEVSS